MGPRRGLAAVASTGALALAGLVAVDAAEPRSSAPPPAPPLRVVPAVAAATAAMPVRVEPVVVAAGDGVLRAVPGTGPVVGTGPVMTYRVEVEGGLGIDPAGVAAAVEQTLSDPRSWTAGDARSLQRVDGEADRVVVLASPALTDALCAPLQTDGVFSCATIDTAVLNAMRWQTGAQAYGPDLLGYRTYLVNHEFGHTLGLRHADCPGPGLPAPVMMQQTVGVGDCVASPWPNA